MSWRDIMQRVLPPIGGISSHITSPYGAVEGRAPSSQELKARAGRLAAGFLFAVQT